MLLMGESHDMILVLEMSLEEVYYFSKLAGKYVSGELFLFTEAFF